MPVNVDKNLTLKNNTMDATYGELFYKLNKAYAWTNTKTTSSGGTAVVLINTGDILTTMECNDVSSVKVGTNINTGCNTYIINNKIYYVSDSSITQIGTKTDYIESTSATSSGNQILYAIDLNGKLWYIRNNVETQIGTDTNWSQLTTIAGSGSNISCCALNNGKLYKINGDSEPTQAFTNLENITVNGVRFYSSTSLNGFCINNGFLYRTSGNTATQIGVENNWVTICPYESISNTFVINSNKQLYYINEYNIYQMPLTNVEEAIAIGNSGIGYARCSNKKIYSIHNATYGNPVATDISNNMEWDSISLFYKSPINVSYGISDNKLYCIHPVPLSPGSVVYYTQVGTEANYNKLSNGIAWTGDATTVTHTILTTKIPQVGDKAYIDEDLNQYSTIQSTGGATVTDQYRTYTRDAYKDSSFTAIPQETIHETVSTIDFLRITNPNT